jgi:hypothetical protein
MKDSYEPAVDTHELFRVEATNDGDGFFAVRDKDPRFVMWGKTILQAVSCAERALAGCVHNKPVPSLPMTDPGGGTWLDQEFAEGYRDGRDRDTPEPSDNRSDAYRHSFAVGRAELAGCPIPAALSRERAQGIEAAEAAKTTKIGLAEGESPVRDSECAHNASGNDDE